jgi:hypothetical protein
MTPSDTEAPVVISGWQLYAVVLFGAAIIALMWVVGPSVAPIQLPSYIWSAAGFCALGLLLIPVHRIVTRAQPEKLPMPQAILGVLTGSVLYAVAMRFLL